ncbi:MAG: HD-GYP domain-containing protein [Solirubrobacteraceae bacterium]
MSSVRALRLASWLLLAGALCACVLASGIGTWDPVVLVVLLAFVVSVDLLDIELPYMHVSAGFLGLLLAMVLLGPAPAAVIGVGSTLVDIARKRPRAAMAVCNLAAWAWFPLLGALVIHWCAGRLHTSISDPAFAAAMLPGFAVATIVNFGIVAVGIRALDGVSVREQVRTVFVPLLPSEAAMALLGSLVVYAYAHIGAVALAMLGALLVVYLWLLRALLISEQRAEQLDGRTRQLASLQVGVLTAMLQTLALRDRMTARHSAAVSRYVRALAQEAGCSEEEQELAHTCGLLHDIGKFIFPDRILLADAYPSVEDWQIIRSHPGHGAHVLRQIDGYGPVAEIVLCHHERIDGTGYPNGIAGDQIPLLSRMISIADTYDVMTARDSYRRPVTPREAITELRRVAGTQLDARLVELFIGLLQRRGVAFRHGDDADFEAELRFDVRVRDYARRSPDAAPSPARVAALV